MGEVAHRFTNGIRMHIAEQGSGPLVPELYMVGNRDLVLAFRGAGEQVAGLAALEILPGCGHWTPQERAEEVTSAMLGFLRGV
jgi:pimeloyl-ACP methyl ester carboxylesterase